MLPTSSVNGAKFQLGSSVPYFRPYSTRENGDLFQSIVNRSAILGCSTLADFVSAWITQRNSGALVVRHMWMSV